MAAINKESYEKIKSSSTEDLRFEVANTMPGDERLYLIVKELDDREIQKQDKNFEKMLDATKANANATRNLVWVTGALVVVTAFLVITPYVKEIGNFFANLFAK